MDNYRLLVEKLDQFIRKYYVNQLIRGALYSVGLILVLFLTMSLLEYNFYFNTTVRKMLVYSFIGISGLALVRWVFTPMLHYFQLIQLKTITSTGWFSEWWWFVILLYDIIHKMTKSTNTDINNNNIILIVDPLFLYVNMINDNSTTTMNADSDNRATTSPL